MSKSYLVSIEINWVFINFTLRSKYLIFSSFYLSFLSLLCSFELQFNINANQNKQLKPLFPVKNWLVVIGLSYIYIIFIIINWNNSLIPNYECFVIRLFERISLSINNLSIFITNSSNVGFICFKSEFVDYIRWKIFNLLIKKKKLFLLHPN